MKLEFGFGTGIQTVEVPDQNVVGVLHANEVECELTGEAEVRRALSAPIGAPLLKDVVKPGEKIAIITSDITRPMPVFSKRLAMYTTRRRFRSISVALAEGSPAIRAERTSCSSSRLRGGGRVSLPPT